MLLKLALILLVFSNFSFSAEKLIVWERIKSYPFELELLRSALRVTEADYGAVELVASKHLQQGEAVDKLIEGRELDIIYAGSDPQRSGKLLPINFALTRGLLGMRVCLINSEDKTLFKILRNVDDFKRFNIKFVMGTHWPDRRVYENEKLSIKHLETYENLFNLAASTKKSCFARGLHEILAEEKIFKASGLELEQSILIQYDIAEHFFVSPKNEKLKERIEKGLLKLASTVEFYKLFWNFHSETFEKIGVFKRKLIKLQTPKRYILEKITNNPRLWLPKRLEEAGK